MDKEPSLEAMVRSENRKSAKRKTDSAADLPEARPTRAASPRLPPKDPDLNALIGERARKLQEANSQQRQRIRQNYRVIQELEKEIVPLRKNKLSVQGYLHHQKLREEHETLRGRLARATAFMAEYGLSWDGDEIGGELDLPRLERLSRKELFKSPPAVSISSLRRRVDELNSILRLEGNLAVVCEDLNGVKRLKQMEPLQLQLYRNGLRFRGDSFFKYGSKEGARIIGDIVDGYFPVVLKKKYPDGVLIEVVDKLAEEHEEPRAAQSLGRKMESAPSAKAETELRGFRQKGEGVFEHKQQDEPSEEDAVLKVRSASGARTFIFRVNRFRTLGGVFQALEGVFGRKVALSQPGLGGRLTSSELRTVEDCGLCNAKLVVVGD